MEPPPFWPRRSPHFLACRLAVRAFDAGSVDTGSRAVIGLSGGPDSLALVAAAAAERKRVRAVVVDHGLQPGSAEAAARAVATAQRLGVPAEVVSVTVGPGNVEAAARDARYAALFSRGDEVWVAHTADDQAETLLLGALRGNPAGMAATETVNTQSGEKHLVRPFLTIRRADTVGACEELGLEPWHDPMNEDAGFRRVAVRGEIVPSLSKLLGGDAVPALAATAGRIAADRQLIELLTSTAPTGDCAELAVDHPALRRRRLAAWLIQHGVPVQADQLAAIEALVTDWRGQGPVHVAGGTVARAGGRLTFRPAG